MSLRFINPIDSIPERIFKETETPGSYLAKNVRDVVNYLVDDEIDLKERTLIENKLKKALRSYGILYDFQIEGGGFGATELKVQVTKDSLLVNIKDVGYGSSLQIAAFFNAIHGEFSGGRIIIIDQPETHIHPFLQSKFIETLVGLGTKNTYIIETHSEHIIRKLLVLSKNKVVSNDDVNLYYFSRTDTNNSEITQHKINTYGKLNPKFPTGFYDVSSSLVKELF